MPPEIPAQALTIIPIQHALDANVRVPGSKSLTNRALLIAALADGFTTLSNALFSDDSIYFANALQNLGFQVNLEPENDCMTVGVGRAHPPRQAPDFVGNAAPPRAF